MKKKMTALLLAVVMVLSLLPVAVSADDAANWEAAGNTAREGTAADHQDYVWNADETLLTIYTAPGLAWLSNQVRGGNSFAKITVLLANNIDLDGGYVVGYGAAFESITEDISWNPIGTEDNPFNGTFDGQGYTVSGVKINCGSNYQGLLGRSDGTIRNVGIANSTINGTASIT